MLVYVLVSIEFAYSLMNTPEKKKGMEKREGKKMNREKKKKKKENDLSSFSFPSDICVNARQIY